ncbi:hypothetical protein Pyn_31394 [Prunus yedoensis var. nudiflora]|uniref:Uncharacterized protein n=1 Tax=Prunus yedoensis var. nudiflora TaxID=2094558 RepID=A0A314YRD5_PRUYE|nr:hypothetical protein Pyn_31394 [Prunus yedoensis var. nudiflora]
MILGWEFPMHGTNVSSKNYWSWMIVENLVCIKQKYTANSQDESAEEHKRKVVVTILYNSGEVCEYFIHDVI